MASSVAVRKGRKHKMRLMTENSDDQMVVKSLSVPPGLETLMEGLTREVLRMQPQDICLFASEHFAKLIKMREASGGEYQFCKTTIHDKIKQKNEASRVSTQQNQQPCPKDDVETFDGTPALSAPRLDFGRLTNGTGPDIKRNISEASTAEIDKLQAGFFNSKPDVKESEEQGNTDEIKEQATITEVKENKAEADDLKIDDGETNKTEEKDDESIKEVNEELAKSKENVQSNTGEEDNVKKENEIQEETKDKVNDKELCENIDKDAKESTNEEENAKQREVTSKEEIATHDEPEEAKNIPNEAEPVNKDNEENQSNIQEAKIEHLETADKESKLNETEKKDSGDNVEDAESKLEATEEQDDLSDSNDVVTQETEQEIKTMSPADKVQISPMEENTNEVSSLEDKPVPSNDTEVKPLEDSIDGKLVDEVEDKSRENESHPGLEKVSDEKDSNKTTVHNMVEDVQTDSEHNIRKRSISQTDEHEVQSLTIPEISTTVATPTPSEDGSISADNVAKEFDESDKATEEEKQIKAATKLQSLWRGYKLRKMQKSTPVDNADEENSEDLHKLTTAATVIQSLWRGYSFRKSKATENTPEVENTNSDETSPDKEATDGTDEQNIAATKIQSSWRGHNVRKKRHIDVNDIASAEEHGKTVGEEKPNEKDVDNEAQEIAKEIMAATVIQALWRGHVTRKSRNLQSANETSQLSSDVDFAKLNLAAAKIQSLWRGHSYRKLQNASTVVAEDEMPAKEMETSEHEKEDTTDPTTADSESKTDKHKSETEKTTEVTEPAVEAEKANETESEHIVQLSESDGNAIVPELDSDKINDTVEPEIQAEKASDVESGNIAETTDTEGNIQSVTASPKSDLEDEKATEEVEIVSKTDAGVPELQNETAELEKTSDESSETTEINDEPKSEVQSEGIVEKSELVVKPEETKSEVEDEGEAKSEEDTDKTAPSVKADETEDEGKQEEVTEKIESAVKADELEGAVKPEEDFDKTEPSVKAEDTEAEGKQEVAEKIKSTVKADELEGETKSEEDADKTEPIVKADETDGEGKQEEDAEQAESAVKADELEEEAKSEEAAEKPEPIVKADETEDEEKQEEVAEKPEPAVNAEEIVKTDVDEENSEENTEKTEPSVKADETEGEIKSEEDADKTESTVKTDESESEVKSEEVVEKVEPAVKADETEAEVKSEEVSQTSEPVIKPDEAESEVKSEVAEKIEPIVKADETEGEIKSEEDADKTESTVKTDETEPEVKSEEITVKTEPTVKPDETEPEVKSEEVSETSEPVIEADTVEAEEVVEPIVKEEVNVETAEPEIKSDEFTDTSESVVKPEEIVEATKTDGAVKSENIAELAEPTESKDIPETTENGVKPSEISEPVVKADEVADKVEPSVVDETTETGESSVSDKDAQGTVNSSTTDEEVTDSGKLDSTAVEPNEIANKIEPVLQTDELSETTASEAKDTEPEKTVESGTDTERNKDLQEDTIGPVSETITQDSAEKIEGSPNETKNENDMVEKTELHSDKEIDSVGSEVKETEETNAIENKETDEAKPISDSDKVSETSENEPAIIPGSENNTAGTENIEVKDADITDKTEAGDNVEISGDSPDNTTITTPSEDPQSEVEHASEITKNSDKLPTESSAIAVSDAAAENKEPECTESTNEGLNEQSATISEDSTEEKSTKLDENLGAKPSDVVVEDNSGKDKVTDSTDNEEKNKDVIVNTDASDTTETQGIKNTESDTSEPIETKETVSETLSPHPLDETEAGVDKVDGIMESEIKKESVEADEASPSNQEENETETTNNKADDKSSEEEKMNETEAKSTNDSITDIKDEIPSEAAENSEVSNENKSDVSEKKSTDDDQSLVKTENKNHVDTPTEGQSAQISNDDTSADNGKQDIADAKAALQYPVKENDAATKIQSTWRGYNVRKSNNIITDTAKSENDHKTEDDVEKPSEDTGSKTEAKSDEINKPTVDTAEKDVEELGTVENNINETPITDETADKVEQVPVEAAKEDVAKEISEPVAEEVEHSTVHSENINEGGTNDASGINNEKTVGDLTKTAEVETTEPVSDTIGNKEDTVSADETVQQDVAVKLEEPSPSSTNNKIENAESEPEDDLEKHVETTNVEDDAKIKEENVTPEVSEDHKDTYQPSEASTVDIRDVEDSLKSPLEAEDSNDLEINVHEDGEKLNESSDTKHTLDADNKVKFYVGPDETNQIQVVDDAAKDDIHGTESDKLAADEASSEQNSEIHKSVTSVLLSALSNDSEELEKGEATKETNEEGEHQNDDTNNVNSSAPNAEENLPENTEDFKENSIENSEDLKENSAENVESEKTNDNEDNQDHNDIHNNKENHTSKSAENVSDIENDKEKLAMNVENFDKALSESENKETESNDVQADADNVADITHKDDTTSVADAQNASAIPQVHENTKNTADTEENNIATETVNAAPLGQEQHAENSENKTDSVQNEHRDPSPTNLHEEKPSESVTKDSNDAETTKDTAEGIVSPVEQQENVEADEATTTAKDISLKSSSDIIEVGTHAADKGNNEHESEETHEVLDSPGSATAKEKEVPHEVENESSVNEEDKPSEDKVDNDPKNLEDEILQATVEDKPHESESQSSASVNDTDENKTVELDETPSPIVTPIEDNQNKQPEHLEEIDTDKNIEESESQKLDETSVVPSTEDIKDNSNEKSEPSEENINDIKKNSEENGHVEPEIEAEKASDVESGNIAETTDSEGNIESVTATPKSGLEDEKATEELDSVSKTDADVPKLQNETAEFDKTSDESGETTENNDEPKSEVQSEGIVEKSELVKPEDIVKTDKGKVKSEEDAEKAESAVKADELEGEAKLEDAEKTEPSVKTDETEDDGKQEEVAEKIEPAVKADELESEVKSEDAEKTEPSVQAAVTKDENKTEEDKAAVKIQSAWKGYHVRQGLHEDKELAILQRPAECDELSSKSAVAEDANVLSQAATTIQAGARGYLVRKRRHLAKLTDMPAENADSTTMDESESVSQETVIEKHELDTLKSFGSTEKSEEDNAHGGTPKEETPSNQEDNKSTIIAEGTKDVESNTTNGEEPKEDGKSITECRNDNDVKKETESKDVDNEKAIVTEPSPEINESLEKHTQKEEETTNENDEQELDEIDALNQRLQNLNRNNVYQIDEEKEPNDNVEDDHKMDSPKAGKKNFDRALSDLHAQTSKSLDDDESVMTAPSQTDDSHNDDARKPGNDSELEGKDKHGLEEPDAENKKVAQNLAEPNTTPRLSVNLDDFDSSKYDLKVEHASPRSKNTSPVHELTREAYKIGAAIAVDSEAIVDSMDENAKDKLEAKPVEYIHIPLQGPLPAKIEEKPVEKETLKASQEHVTTGKNKDDGESPEYIYIPLKPPGTVDGEDEQVAEESASKENMEEVDNQKEDVKNETGTIPQPSGENKDDNEDKLKEKLAVSESTEENADSADTKAVLEDKAKEDNNSNKEEHVLSEKEHADAKEINETLANHGIEKESDNETEQISKLPETIPLTNKSSEPLSEAKSTEPDVLEPKSPEQTDSEKLAEKSPELSESQPTHSVFSEEPIEKVTAKENLEKSSVSETKTPEAESLEFKSTDSTVSGQSTEHLTVEDKSLVEHASAEPELSENKSPETVLSDTKASDAILSDKPKTPEVVEKSTPTLGKSTSPIDDIDAFLQRTKSRTISRQPNVDAASHRTLFAEIDSLIDAYGQKRQMSPTSSTDHPDLAAAKIDNESRAQGQQQLSVQDDLPDVIMANSNGAATKIQSAFRGYHTRQQLLKEGANRLKEPQQVRKDSPESDKTYTIDKPNGSTPEEEVSSDDDEVKNNAATKIQTTFRAYRKKRSIEHGKSVEENVEQKSEENEEHVTETCKEDENMKESVEQSNKVEDACPDGTSEQEDQNKELKGFIENKENQQQSEDTTSVVDGKDTDGEKVTNENLPDNSEVQQLHAAADYDSLNSEPERRHSPEVGQVQDLKITKLEDKFLDHVVTNDSGTDAKHEQLRDISEITHDAATKIQSTYRGFKTRQTLKNNNELDGSLETIPEVMSPTNLNKEQGKNKHTDEEPMNNEQHIHTNGTVVQPSVKSFADVDDSSRPNSATVQKYKSTTDVAASTSDAWRYQLLHDATSDAESTAKDDTSSGMHSDEEDNEPYADTKLVQGYHHQHHGTHHQQQTEQPRAGLQHSGETHDTLDIFLSSEELSQGAEVLTSRDTSTTDDVSGTHAQCGAAAKHEGPEQHDDHSVMESAKHQNKNNASTTQHNHLQQQQQQQQQPQQQQTDPDMGNDEAVAATKIQAGFRGYQVRKQMKLKKNGSDDAKMVKRCSSGRRRGSLRRGDNSNKNGTDLEERSATKIQAGIRGFLVRKRQKSTKDKQ